MTARKDSDRNLVVHCYSGYRGQETPRSFQVGGERIEISRVVGRWRTPEHRVFEVLDERGKRHLLRHHAGSDRWELTRSGESFPSEEDPED